VTNPGTDTGMAARLRRSLGALDGDDRSVAPLRAIAIVVLVLLAVLGLREVADLLVPILFGLFLALIVAPVISRLQARGMGRSAALAGAVGVVLAVVVVTAIVIAFSVGELVVRVPTYQDRLTTLLSDVESLLAGFGIAFDPEALPALVSSDAVASLVRPIGSAVSGGLGALFVMLFTLVYALTGARSMRARAQAALGEHHAIFAGVERFGTDLRRYLVVRAQLGLFAAVLVLVLLVVLGVPLAALWAFLVFAASFIPTIGTFIALVPPTVLALLESGPGTAAAVAVGYTLVNLAQDYLLQPRMMGTELNLSPLVVFLSVIAWAWILGPAGALLAVPLTVGLVVLLEAYPGSRPVGSLMRNTLEPPIDAGGAHAHEDRVTE
jgi:predicted PurR-regulated permease PerM